MPSDIEPEHWIAARRQRYNTAIALVSLALIAALVVLAYVEYKGKVNVVIGVQQGELGQRSSNGSLSHIAPTANAAELDFVEPEDNPLTANSQPADGLYPGQEIDIGYRQEYDGKTLMIEPNFRYLDRLEAQELVEPAYFTWEPFTWKFPELSFKVSNNSRDTLYISSIQIQVNQSEIDRDPLLVVRGRQSNGIISITNYGWGDIVDPMISLDLSEYSNECPKTANGSKFKPAIFSDNEILLNTFEFAESEFFSSNLNCSSHIDALCFEGDCTYYSELSGIKCLDQERSTSCTITEPAVPRSLIDDFVSEINEFTGVPVQAEDVTIVRECRYALVCALGELTYKTEYGNEEAFRFRMPVDLNPPGTGVNAPPTYTYDVFLPAGRANYFHDLPISQVIAPRDTDHFLLRVATDMSARFELHVSLFDTGGNRLAESDVRLRTVVPRGSERYLSDQ